MKILHIDPDDIDNPMSGGGPRRTFEIYRRLADRHDITVLTPTFPGSTPEKMRDGVRYVRLGRKIGDHASSHHITFFCSLPTAVRQFDYDLLVEDFMPPASATLTPLFARGPVIASVQWFFAKILAKQFHMPFHWWEHFGLRLYDNFIVQTSTMEAHIKAARPSAVVRRIPLGSDNALFEMAPTYPGDFALYMGRIDVAQKGVDLLLDAWRRVPVASRIPLILAGHAAALSPIEALIARYGLSSCVQLVGKVTGAERQALFQQARFVCVPSREETFGLVILEACAAAKPVILFDVAPMNEVAAPGGSELVPAFDVDAFANRIQMLSALSPEELTRRGNISRRWANRFSWDAIANEQDAFYHECVDAYARKRRG